MCIILGFSSFFLYLFFFNFSIFYNSFKVFSRSFPIAISFFYYSVYNVHYISSIWAVYSILKSTTFYYIPFFHNSRVFFLHERNFDMVSSFSRTIFWYLKTLYYDELIQICSVNIIHILINHLYIE